jgi:hypothetical protein
MTLPGDDIKPSTDLTLKEALDSLTGFEVLAIEGKFGRHLEDLGGMSTLIGAVWAVENRSDKVSWPAVQARTMRELNGFFTADDDHADEDSEQGKGSG